jgi:hypothetical protein
LLVEDSGFGFSVGLEVEGLGTPVQCLGAWVYGSGSFHAFKKKVNLELALLGFPDIFTP